MYIPVEPKLVIRLVPDRTKDSSETFFHKNIFFSACVPSLTIAQEGINQSR